MPDDRSRDEAEDSRSRPALQPSPNETRECPRVAISRKLRQPLASDSSRSHVQALLLEALQLRVPLSLPLRTLRLPWRVQLSPPTLQHPSSLHPIHDRLLLLSLWYLVLRTVPRDWNLLPRRTLWTFVRPVRPLWPMWALQMRALWSLLHLSCGCLPYARHEHPESLRGDGVSASSSPIRCSSRQPNQISLVTR